MNAALLLLRSGGGRSALSPYWRRASAAVAAPHALGPAAPRARRLAAPCAPWRSPRRQKGILEFRGSVSVRDRVRT